MNWGHILFSFSGRINRAKWWLAVLVYIIIAIVAAIVSGVLKSDGLTLLLNLVVTVVWLWISLAAGAKRLHDLDRTGAWLVVFVAIPFVLSIVFVAVLLFAIGSAVLAGQASEAEIMREVMRMGAFLAVYGIAQLALLI